MNEEKIIKSVLHIQKFIIDNAVEVGVNTWAQVNSLGQLVDLYNKEKEKNKELEKDKDKIRKILDYQYELWNTPNRQKEYNSELVGVLEDLLNDNNIE